MGRKNIAEKMKDRINFILVPVSIAECIGYSVAEGKEAGEDRREKEVKVVAGFWGWVR